MSAIALLVMVGCSTFKSDVLLFVDVARKSLSSGPELPTTSTGLDLKYRYLMVQVVGVNAAMLVLSSEHETANGLLEVWVAADGSMIQTLNGRLASNIGMSIQWPTVRWMGTPLSSDVSAPVQVTRFRDVLPAYVYNVSDAFDAAFVDFALVPENALPSQGGRGHWKNYKWLRESMVTTPINMRLGESWVALGKHRGQQGVVASYQCLSATICIKTARWPLEPVGVGEQ